MRSFIIFIFLLLFICMNCFANSHLAYKQFNRPANSVLRSQKLIPLGRTRSQDSIGNCYSFSMSKRLEHICQSSQNCAFKGQEVSPLHIQSALKGGISSYDTTGGNTEQVLNSLKHVQGEALYLVKESCAPYDQMVYRTFIKDDKGNLTNRYYENEYQGLLYLEDMFAEVLSNSNKDICIDCSIKSLNKIVSEMGSLKNSEPEILKLIDNVQRIKREEFVSKTLIPEKCFSKNEMIKIPKFSYHDFGGHQIAGSEVKLAQKITELLEQNITPELIHCSSPVNDNGKRICGLHAVIIHGKREWCSGSTCKIEYKVKNSWGKDWDDSHNGGWIDGETLLKYSLNEPVNDTEISRRSSAGNTLNWLEPKNPVVNKIRANKTNKATHDVITPTEKSENQEEEFDHTKMYKCKTPGEPTAFVDSVKARVLSADGVSCEEYSPF